MFGMLASPALPTASVTHVWSAVAAMPAERGTRGGSAAAERVLDVVAEDPEEEHVAEEVLPAAVHEHRREDRDETSWLATTRGRAWTSHG